MFNRLKIARLVLSKGAPLVSSNTATMADTKETTNEFVHQTGSDNGVGILPLTHYIELTAL
jgi:hypothetical protein